MADQSTPMNGAQRIAAERDRQHVIGYTPTHDDHHSIVELWDAACAYAFRDPTFWPWEPDSFRPHPHDRARELVKAGALFAAVRDFAQRRIDAAAAEIDREAARG